MKLFIIDRKVEDLQFRIEEEVISKDDLEVRIVIHCHNNYGSHHQ